MQISDFYHINLIPVYIIIATLRASHYLLLNPHFLPTRNIPLEQKSQSQSTAQQPDPGPL